MKSMKHTLTFLTALLLPLAALHAAAGNESSPAGLNRTTLAGAGIRASLRPDGTINVLEVKSGEAWEVVKFRDDKLSGPAWADIPMAQVPGGGASFAGETNGIKYSLRYEIQGKSLAVMVGISNQSQVPFAPKAARLVLGIDSEMATYPSWNDRFFPTLLRCEPTHFWGYFMTPSGRILGIGSAQPIASYTINYDKDIWSSGDGQHLVFTSSLDMLHELPLPARHPQNLTRLMPGEERSWTIVLQPVKSLDEVKPLLSAAIRAPMITADRYTLAAKEESHLTVHSQQPPHVVATAPDGAKSDLPVELRSSGVYEAKLAPQSGPGLYTVVATDDDGHRSEATIFVRHPWSWYMNAGREASILNKQYASSHLEQWLGLQTGVLAHWRLPNPVLDKQTDQRLKEILKLQWDLDKKLPIRAAIGHRTRMFPNTAQMAGILGYRYLIDQDPYWLNLASGFADYVVSKQSADGNYVNYTSVFYPVKSLIEVMAAEKLAGAKDPGRLASYERHRASVQKAADYLCTNLDNIQTEGQRTYEDGMISCSAAQLGLFALLEPEGGSRQKYAEAARKMLRGHRCLEQLLIPDARMNGATLRFWEAQYDTLLGKSKNMMNSPHGWSAWLIPALWYQYLLTGEEVWLQKTMNALGSCAQLVDAKTGELRWAFVPDPYREVSMLERNPETPGRGKRVEKVIGEQYVPMIASFHYPNAEPIIGNDPNVGWTCCNDVNEVFIAMEEVALTSAYVIERGDGTLVAWNCKVTKEQGGGLAIQPAESVVSRVHVNLKKQRHVTAKFDKGGTVSGMVGGMQWLGPGGVPEILR